MISYDFENLLWDKSVLGEQDPDILRDTVLFSIGINYGLRAGDEHYYLRRSTPEKESQFTFQHNSVGKRCVVYTEDTITKTNDGGLANMRKDRKIVWIYPSDNINCCPVRLIDKYISLCPPVKSVKHKSNFYLRSLEKINPAQWYSHQVVGICTLRKTIGRMLKDAKLDGFFTNHSLRRSGTSRLFQAGVDRKIIKEYTGHRSDVVDQYQITSEAQRQELSAILAHPKASNATKEKQEAQAMNSVEVKLTDKSGKGNDVSCSCLRQKVTTSKLSDVSGLVDQIVNARKGEKVRVKIEVTYESK